MDENEMREKYSKAMVLVMGTLQEMEERGEVVIKKQESRLTEDGLALFKTLKDAGFDVTSEEFMNCLRYLVESEQVSITEKGQAKGFTVEKGSK